MIRAAAALLALAAAACANADAPPDSPGVDPGIWGDVQMSGETGDLGGIELELIGTGADARVEFVFCEGWCNEVIEAPVVHTDKGFRFSYTQQVWVEDRPEAGPAYTVEAVPLGDDLQVTMRQAPWDAGEGWEHSSRLKRLESPFGLSVARQD